MKQISKLPATGKNIHALRKRRNLTLDNLAAKSGVSKAMLSQIESEKVNPTIATVWKIAYGLGVDFQNLIKGEEEQTRKFKVNRSQNITSLDIDKEDAHIQVLSPITMADELELYILTFKPNGSIHSAAHYPKAEEFLTVLEGRVKVTAGENSAELDKGDFVMYHCDVEHSIVNLSKEEAKIYIVVKFNKED